MEQDINSALTQVGGAVFQSLVAPVLQIAVPLLIIGVAVLLLIRLVQWLEYRKSSYRAVTHKSFGAVSGDKDTADQLGARGEYLIEHNLKGLSGYHRFLFNCYLPKDDGKTTEIDAILLHTSGIYVFESKNYSGWIFGRDSDRYWTQTLPAGKGKSRKERFYNPVKQNEGHIKWLLKYLSDLPNLRVYSFILFSDRCELKNINLTGRKHHVIHRGKVRGAVESVAAREGVHLSASEIDAIYDRLYPLTQVTAAERIAHLQSIREAQNKAAPHPKTRNRQEVCPLCGAPLALRTVEKGEDETEYVYICSDYPKCRYNRPAI